MDEGAQHDRRADRGRILRAWLVILICTIAAAWSAFANKQAQAGDGPGADAAVQEIDLQAKLLVGQAQVAAPDEFSDALDTLDEGPLTQRLRVVILAAELEDPDGARARLEGLAATLRSDGEPPPGAADAQLLALLQKLYGEADDGRDTVAVATATDGLAPADRTLLTEQLGWTGRLALAPRGTSRTAEREALLAEARGAMLVMLATGGGACCAGSVGFALLVGLLIALATGKLRAAWAAPTCGADVLVEIFAVWFVIITAPHVVAAFAPGLDVAASRIAFFVCFLSLLVARLRGVPWIEVRTAIGWGRGTGVFRESAIGVAACFALLPLAAVGLLLTGMLMGVAKRFDLASDATHPVVGTLEGAGLGTYLLVLLLAAVLAPIAEELFFRGVLYRHVRDASAGLGRGPSVLLSALSTALVFAAVHPQSWIAIPALGSLGVGFALIREWRDSLVAPSVAHGVWNATAVTISWLLLR